MMRTVKKVANSYNCESLEIANPSFLSLKNRGLANPSKVANREHCESLRARFLVINCLKAVYSVCFPVILPKLAVLID